MCEENGQAQVRTRFLDLVALEKGNAETITQAVTETAARLSLPLNKLTAFASDGAAVMTGVSWQ